MDSCLGLLRKPKKSPKRHTGNMQTPPRTAAESNREPALTLALWDYTRRHIDGFMLNKI